MSTRLECSLVEAHNALQVQSDRDSRGVRNADGWGIAHCEGLRPVVIKSTDPAFADCRFPEAATKDFLLSDGRHMVASRWGHTLFWTFRRGITDCAVCGTPHCPAADETYRAVVIASEPITDDEDWTELPEGSVLGVAPNAHTMKRDLLAAANR